MEIIEVTSEKKRDKEICGRDYGKKVRKRLDLDSLDKGKVCDVVEISFDKPITVQFFIGLFGSSVKRLGKDGFSKKYMLHGCDKYDEVISLGIKELVGGSRKK